MLAQQENFHYLLIVLTEQKSNKKIEKTPTSLLLSSMVSYTVKMYKLDKQFWWPFPSAAELITCSEDETNNKQMGREY